jgi:hypothetical protein
VEALSRWFRKSGSPSQPSSNDVAKFRDELFALFPITPEARHFFETDISLEVHDLSSTRGGGYWWPDQRKVELFTAQYEAAIHEFAHAWWHDRRLQDNNATLLMKAVERLATEPLERYADTARLAHHYVYGIRTQPDPNSPTGYWRGMLVDRNDWEMFAGLASGCMADIRMLPRYVRVFYEGLYETLPDGAPSPVSLAPHR